MYSRLCSRTTASCQRARLPHARFQAASGGVSLLVGQSMVLSAVLREFRGGGAPTLAPPSGSPRCKSASGVLGLSGRVLVVAWVLVRPAGFWKDSACRR
jgi:hypothetical protein